jgi:hypothetical protein
VCQHDHTAVDAGKQFLCDLADLNSKMAARLCSATSQFVSTGDILSGISNCSMGELALFNCWRNGPIHGDKIACTRIAVGLVDKVLTKALPEDDLRNSIPTKKRPREETPPRVSYRSSRSVPTPDLDRHGDRRSREQPGSSRDYYGDNRRQEQPGNRRSEPSGSAHNTYPGDFSRCGRDGRYR